ncbi:MAG: AAA family ATPase [Ignavibacteriales bacterium]|nr:AAA family ATPase [Ignavibacteriales bacterium]
MPRTNGRYAGLLKAAKSKIKQDGVAWENIISRYEYNFLKSYLYAVHIGKFHDEKLTILRCLGINLQSYHPNVPRVFDSGSETFYIVEDEVLNVNILWENELYEMVVSIQQTERGYYTYCAFCLGVSVNARKPKDVLEHCVSQAIRNSYYKNNFLRVIPTEDYERSISISIGKIEGKNLSEIFLPKENTESLQMFIDAVKNFDTIKKPLRYLLSGKPGTGKTESVRAIMKECNNYATFLFVEGNCNLLEVFRVASLFSPAVLCLDDIDLICGNREDGLYKNLGSFLNLMDGLQNSNLFVLATTNDKRLVDVAASRPGRFDTIMDIEILESSLYLDLVQKRCANEKIIQLFTESVIQELRAKKVSGAFVVNLLKHLEIKHSLSQEKVDEEYVFETLERLHKGFYKRASPVTEPAFGFEAN